MLYNELQGLIIVMQEYVSGTVTNLQTLPHRGLDDEIQLRGWVFRRLFWTFKSCVRAFPQCKLLVQVDVTWLYSKYTQILLIADEQDDNQNVLPISFAIMESENFES